MKIYNYHELKDSRLLYDKNPPKLMPIVLFLISGLLIILLILSFICQKTCIIKTQGSITSESKHFIMCSVSGEIVDCIIKEGSKVEKNDVIAKVQSSEIKMKQQELSEQLNLLTVREEKCKKLQQCILSNTNLFKSNSVDDSEFYNRYESVCSELRQFDSDFNNQQFFDNVENKKDQIRKKYLSEISSEVAKITLEKQNAQIQIDAINIQEDQFNIRASASGVIHMISPIDNGIVVQAGTTIASVCETENLLIEGIVSSVDRSKINLGQDVNIAVGGFPKTDFGYLSGKIQNIDTDATVDEKTGNVLFKFHVKPSSNALRGKNDVQASIIPGLIVQIDVCYSQLSYFNYFRQIVGI